MTEKDYAMKFCMLILEDEKNILRKAQYKESMKYILESYSRILKEHPSIIMTDRFERNGKEDYSEVAELIKQVCLKQKIDILTQYRDVEQSMLFGGLVEELARTLTLVKYYAPEGELLAAILSDAYCSPRVFTEVNICGHLNISRATLYRRKPKALLYAGYYFYEAVLPDMAGKI